MVMSMLEGMEEWDALLHGGHVSMSSNIRRGRLCAYVSEKLYL